MRWRTFLYGRILIGSHGGPYLQYGPLRWTTLELISANWFVDSLQTLYPFVERKYFTFIFKGQFYKSGTIGKYLPFEHINY